MAPVSVLRLLPRRLASALVVAYSAACGPDAGTDAGCPVFAASSLDKTCTVDSDCALVPPGGNVCDLPTTGCEGADFVCVGAAVNTSVATDYWEAIGKAVATECPAGTDTSCPANLSARCIGGTCTTCAPSSGLGDAGVRCAS